MRISDWSSDVCSSDLNPARFLKLARPLTPACILAGLLLAAIGIYGGLFLTPPDYLQGESVRIIYVHVPAAWLGMAGYGFIAAASAVYLVWRHPLADVAARAAAPDRKSTRLNSRH